jgi:hypothetical protein
MGWCGGTSCPSAVALNFYLSEHHSWLLENLGLDHFAERRDLPAALTTIARASRGRSAASSSIALRKLAMARSAVRASRVGGI